MAKRFSRQSRTERIIVTGRAILAGFFYLAIYLDPTEPTMYADLTYTILICYFGYAVIFALVTWSPAIPRGRLQIITHALDLVVFVVIMFLTEGPTSPFFVYFMFLLICATMRWPWRGTLWTVVVTLAAMIAMALYPSDLLRDPNFELNRFIIRLVYLSVVAVMLGYLGAHEQTQRAEITRLAAWPRTISMEVSELARGVLEHAAKILGAPRLLLFWEEREEPWLHHASWSQGEFHYAREAPNVFWTLVTGFLNGKSFFCPNVHAYRPMVVW